MVASWRRLGATAPPAIPVRRGAGADQPITGNATWVSALPCVLNQGKG